MYELHIPGMSCNHCIRTISNAVMAAVPQAGLEFDLNAKRVTIDADVEESALVRIVEDSGYRVESSRTLGHAAPGHHCEHCGD